MHACACGLPFDLPDPAHHAPCSPHPHPHPTDPLARDSTLELETPQRRPTRSCSRTRLQFFPRSPVPRALDLFLLLVASMQWSSPVLVPAATRLSRLQTSISLSGPGKDDDQGTNDSKRSLRPEDRATRRGGLRLQPEQNVERGLYLYCLISRSPSGREAGPAGMRVHAPRIHVHTGATCAPSRERESSSCATGAG